MGISLKCVDASTSSKPKNGKCFGTLEAKMSDWIGKRKTEWEKDEGFNRSQAEMPGGPVAYDEDSLDDLIQGVNEKKEGYYFVLNNCQDFVNRILTHLGVESLFEPVKTKIGKT